jgi:dynein heavy chain
LSSLLTHRLVSSLSQAACASLTAVTLSLYSFILERLPPTPSRFHYIFNLRDLSRIFEGLCLSTPDKFSTPAHFLRLWRNECLRIFHDRLISEEDKAVVQTKIRELVNDKYGMHADTVLADPILFGDYRLALKVGGCPSFLELLIELNGNSVEFCSFLRTLIEHLRKVRPPLPFS